MPRTKSKEEEAELTLGPNINSDGESPPRSCSVDRESPMLISKEEAAGDDITVSPEPKKKRRRLPVVKGSWHPVLGYEIPHPLPPDKTQIEQFMNESLKQWFRLEYLMDYDCLIDKLYCMICTTTLPSLSIIDVKTHILDNHPTSVYFSPAQKGILVEAWINRRETSEEFVEIEEEMDDDEEEESELDLTKSDMNDEDDELDISVTESRSELKIANLNVDGKSKYKGEQDKVYVPLLEEESLSTTKRQTEKSKLETGNVALLEDKEKKVRRKKRLTKEGKKTRKEMHSESDDLKDEAKTFEKQDLQDATVLKKQKKPTEVDKQKLLEEEKCKVKEKQLLKEQKSIFEASVLEEVQEKAKMGHHLREETNKAEDSLQLQEKPKAVKGQLLEEEKQKAKALQQLQEEQCKDRKVQHMEEKVKQVTVKEVQTVSQELQSVDESIVKIEEEEPLEPLNMCIGKGNSTIVQTSFDTIKKEQEKQSDPKLPEEGKKLSMVSEKQIIQVQQVQQVPQTPTVLGIGVPLLKMETPAPIIIARVSVLPEHRVITPLKPKPSPSTSEVSKAYRVIAPKVTAPVEEPKTMLPVTGTDTPQWAAGIDPVIWEVSLWQENSSNSINRSQINAYQMRWRPEFLMDYNGLRGSVVCMYCCSSLTVLKESSIKRHIAQKHPHTSSLSVEEKSAVMLDWENKLGEVKKLVAQQNKDEIIIGDTGINILRVPDCDAEEDEEPESNWAGALSDGKVASWEFAFGRVQGQAPKDPRKYQHDRWKLEFLMDYTPAKDGLICMVCGVTLINPKISTVKMHIQQKHPDTIYLSDQEKAVVIEEWEQRLIFGKKGSGCASGSVISQQAADDEICIEINEDTTTSETNGSSAEMVAPRTEIILPTISKPPKPIAALPPPCNSAKRSYKVRWRTEFMMDYDCRRQGLICMVCGGTLATLKVSTIKRHIVQVHPYSVDFTSEERQRILEAYSEMALHYIHSEECFKVQPQEEVKGRKRKSVTVEEA